MTTRELFEQANLDALGLLDEEERAAFERAFRAASPAVRAQIRREQLRMSDLESLLPDVDPPVGLRHKVLARWREAVLNVGSAGRISPEALGRRGSSAPIWRAACIGFATATVVISMFFVWMAQEHGRMAETVQRNTSLDDLQRAAGPELLDLLTAPQSRRLTFVAAHAESAEAGSTIRLYFDPERETAGLLCRDLPISPEGEHLTRYRLVIERPDGAFERVHEFTAQAGVFSSLVAWRPDLAGQKLAIVRPAADGSEEVMFRVRTA